MPTVERHAAGEFCWIELATSNQDSAKKFYAALFGWTVRDVPTGPNEVYSLFELQGRITASAFTIGPDESAVPPHWHLYIAVASADETATKAQTLGGKVVEAPFDVSELGRAALIQDPMGAFFSIWEPKKRSGIAVTGDPSAFCWAELSTPDQPRVKTFYEGLFGWKLKLGEGKQSGYLHIANGENYIGGVPPADPSSAGQPPHWLVYFAVADVNKAFQSALDTAARGLLPPTHFEGVGRIAVLADPQGAVFAIFQPPVQ